MKDGGILVSAAMDSWTNIDYVTYRYLEYFLYWRDTDDIWKRKLMEGDESSVTANAREVVRARRRDLEGRIQRFMEADPSRGAFVARKVAEYLAYRAERKRLMIDDSEDDEQEKEEQQQAEKEEGASHTKG